MQKVSFILAAGFIRLRLFKFSVSELASLLIPRPHHLLLIYGLSLPGLATECRAVTDCSSGRCVATTVCGDRPLIDQRLQRQYQDLEKERSRLLEEKRVIEAERERRREAQSVSVLRLQASVTEPNSLGEVQIVIDASSELASLKVNDVELGWQRAGLTSFTRIPRVGEVTIYRIEARDEFGNVANEALRVDRALGRGGDALVDGLRPLTIQPLKPRDAIAIIIGVERYRRIPAAEFANRDASAFVDYAVRALGVRQESIKLLLDEKADAAEILVAFRNWLPTRVNKGKTDVYVFYSGHGLPSPDGNSLYFLPHEANRDLLDRTAISQSELVEALQRASPKSVTMFIDSCYSGQSRTGETLLASARPIAVTGKQSSFPPNFTVISASAPDQISSSSPDLKHGIFSYYLMRGMEGEADGNKDGQITVAEMQTYLSERVSRRAMGMNRTQQPQVIGDQSRVLVGR